jgi:hypothetical protein
MAAVQQYVGRNESSVINLHIWPGAGGRMRWYEDDGESMDYSRGGSLERDITFIPSRNGGLLSFWPAKGSYPSAVRTWRIILRCAERAAKGSLDGKRIKGRFDRRSKILAFEIPHSAETMTFRIN